MSAVKILLPKDQKLLNEATKHAEALLNKGEETNTDIKAVVPAVAPESVLEPKATSVESVVVVTESTLNVPENSTN